MPRPEGKRDGEILPSLRTLATHGGSEANSAELRPSWPRGTCMRAIVCVALALLLAVSASRPARAVEPDAPQALITRAEAIRIAVQANLSEKFTTTTNSKKAEQGALVEYYAVADQPTLWVDEHGLTERGKAVMAEIEQADDYGLRASDYPLPKLAEFTGSGPSATQWLADAELKISYAVLGYARDARGGRINPSRLSPNLDPDLVLPNPSEVIESIAIRSDPAAYLRSFQPDQPQFEALRQKLIELQGGKTEVSSQPAAIIPDGPLLKLGVVHEQVALLRKRLDLPSDTADATSYDDHVLDAVRKFQLAHGSIPDGMVGAGMRQLLNSGGQRPRQVGSTARIRSVLINMERWRWLPHDLGQFYVAVNVPEFVLRVTKEGKVIHTTKVVVGKTDKQTPIFGQDMQEIVFNPYWNVPNSIKTEEIRPYLREEGAWLFGGGGWNTSVLERHGLKINYGGREVDPSTLDWNRIDIRALNIYQPPGPDNVFA